MITIKNSIVKKIGFIIFMLVFIMFITYYHFLNNQIKRYLEQQNKEQLTIKSEHLTSKIEMFLQKYIVIIDHAKINQNFISLAKDVTDRSKKREHPLFAQTVNELKNIRNLDKHISSSYIAIEKASDIISDKYNYEIDANYNLSSREWYINTIKENKTTITTPYIDYITNKTAITIAAPLEYNNQILGVVGVDILIENINSIMNDYKLKTNTDIGLIYKTGQMLYNSDYSDVIESNGVYIQNLFNEELVSKMLSGGLGIEEYINEGQDKYIAFFPVENTNLIVYTTILKSKALSKVNEFIYINFGILLILLIVIVVSLLLLNKLITKPLVSISREVSNFSNNNTVALSSKYLERKDEVGILSKGISLMINNISSNIAELEEKNQELLNAKELVNMERLLFETTIHSLGDGVISTDKFGNIKIMNEVAEKLTGWNCEDAIGLQFESVFNIINEQNRKKTVSPIEVAFVSSKVVKFDENILLINKEGYEIPIEDSAAPILDSDGNITGAVIVFRDYTDKKQRQAEILYLSYHDQLTGLYNRRFFEEELSRLDIKYYLPLSLVMLDVNGLKLTNDAFGHQTGDKLLQIVAASLKKACRENDVVSRVGGDEFVLLLPNTDYNEAEIIVKLIYRDLEQEKLMDVIISVSAGWDTKSHELQNIMEIYAKAEENMYRNKLVESQSMRSKTIQVIMKTLNETNERERIHSENVSKISRKIGEALNFDQELLREIEITGLLHDIGKIAIDNNLLNKTGPLSSSEYEIIKRHPEIGYHILKSVDEYTNISDNVLAHHEYWDGTGYPRGIAEDKIPLIARIITIADAFEAMTADRTYRDKISKEEAMEELKRCAGTQFDPDIVKIFCDKVIHKI